ncbi:unnamed protein product [Malus baccata var. baccata]
MGISFSCPLSQYSDLESGLDSIIVKSISFGDNEVKTPVRSVSFNGGDAEPTIMKSLGSGRMTLETSVSFKGRELEKMMLLKVPSLEKSTTVASVSPLSKEMNVPSPRSDSPLGMIRPLQLLDPTSPKHMAAIKLQKVYKSFRTRRKLADCAVLVEQSWWKLLDFAELKRSSISFFEIEKHETAMSRWSRARTRAAKVGKGLSKNEKAQKLALQHWLEAIDPRHRYGHNLHFYYVEWLHYIGEGKEVNLVEKCPRSKLQQQCIKYLGPMERMAYEVVVEDGKFLYKQSGELLHTTGESDDTKWIFVLSASRTLYVGKKKKGTFQHSSFLAGGATSAAGRLVVENGILKAVWPHSGHYRPTEENFRDFVSFLEENNVDLKDVKKNLFDENNDETEGEAIPRESILKRINSHKGMKSFQLGRQLSCKWTTGAGPRIGCVRDYPSELQFRALEHVNLSPRSAARSRSYFSPRTTSALSPRVLTPAKCGGEMEARISSPALERVKLSVKSINLSRTRSSQLSTGSTATAIANVS